ncbi:MAG: hypothetical protein IIW08_07555, partial [Clostridia bacterium]|nr:hypothetical protein [Clostridia bacterium]
GEGDNSLSIFNRFWRHVRQNRAFSLSYATKTLPLPDPRPEIPLDFRGPVPPIKKGTFLMARILHQTMENFFAYK